MIQKNQIVIYVALTLTLSGAISAAAYAADKVGLSFLTVFTPSLVAIGWVLGLDGRGGVKRLFIDPMMHQFELRWLLIALLVFPGIAVLAVGLHSLAGGPSLALRTSQLFPQLVVILMISLGEEFGWRGYLLPKLQEKYNALKASLILGIIWSLWHWPGSLIGVGTPQNMPFIVFMAWVVTATIVITWVYNNTGNLLMAVVMHSMANITFNYLPLLPEFAGQWHTFLLFLMILMLFTAAVVWHYGGRRMTREHATGS